MKYYIYKTTNIINNMIYIGVSTRGNDATYLGSGPRLLEALTAYGRENFKKEVLEVFNNEQDALNREKELVNDEFISRADTYNINAGGAGGTSNTNMATVNLGGKYIQLPKNDIRIKSGETVPINTGTTVVRDTNTDEVYRVDVNDDRIKTGELVSFNSGTLSVENKDGVRFRVSTDDIRLSTGELTHIGKENYIKPGERHSRDTEYREGDKWMYKPNQEDAKVVRAEQVNAHIEDGWIFGRGEEIKYWIHKSGDSITKKVNSKDLDLYLSKGWSMGRSTTNITRWMYHPDKDEYHEVSINEVLLYEREGWVKRTPPRSWVYDPINKNSFTVPKDELNKYLSEGFIKGRGIKK